MSAANSDGRILNDSFFDRHELLVGGLVAMFYFPRNIGLRIIPIYELIFFRGVAQPPTSKGFYPVGI